MYIALSFIFYLSLFFVFLFIVAITQDEDKDYPEIRYFWVILLIIAIIAWAGIS